jgi:hypothetical protein
MKATIKFATEKQAEEFCKAWSRHTSGGHTSGVHALGGVWVTVYNVNEDNKKYIDNYINNLNR